MESTRNITKTFISANLLTAQVSHNGLQGGDAGHGGFVIINLKDSGETAFDVSIIPNNEEIIFEQPNSVKLSFYGDSERETLIESLEFILDELKNNQKVNESYHHRFE
jgi:hypothetical protein